MTMFNSKWKYEKFAVGVSSRYSDATELGNFTLLLCRGPQRNAVADLGKGPAPLFWVKKRRKEEQSAGQEKRTGPLLAQSLDPPLYKYLHRTCTVFSINLLFGDVLVTVIVVVFA